MLASVHILEKKYRLRGDEIGKFVDAMRGKNYFNERNITGLYAEDSPHLELELGGAKVKIPWEKSEVTLSGTRRNSNEAIVFTTKEHLLTQIIQYNGKHVGQTIERALKAFHAP